MRSFSSKNDETDAAKTDTDTDTSKSPQNQEWAKFQQSLTFTNLDDDSVFAKKKKTRGGKILRKKKEKALELQNLESNSRMFDVGTGQFPPMRYSDEETEKLLKEAYSEIPERAGKRGTRSLRRQKNRFFAIRKAAAKKKRERIAHHFATMEKRSRIAREVREIKQSAEEVRMEDNEYQKQVLRKWAAMQGMVGSSENTGGQNKEI